MVLPREITTADPPPEEASPLQARVAPASDGGRNSSGRNSSPEGRGPGVESGPSLGESPFLNIVSGERVQETLRFMRRPPDEPVTRELGREICERQNAKALVTGDIVALGSRFVIGLEALACRGGEVLVRTQEEAANKESVLRAVDWATTEVRRKLGESLPSIEARNTPLERATTSSLEALKAFSQGEARFIEGQQIEALPFYKRAIDLDPDFAMAYAKVGVVYANTGERNLLAEYLTKAFELRDRVGERYERFFERWKDADPDVPILKDARAEYAHLTAR